MRNHKGRESEETESGESARKRNQKIRKPIKKSKQMNQETREAHKRESEKMVCVLGFDQRNNCLPEKVRYTTRWNVGGALSKCGSHHELIQLPLTKLTSEIPVVYSTHIPVIVYVLPRPLFYPLKRPLTRREN